METSRYLETIAELCFINIGNICTYMWPHWATNEPATTTYLHTGFVHIHVWERLLGLHCRTCNLEVLQPCSTSSLAVL